MRKLLRLSAITALACIPLVGCSDDDLVNLGPIGGSAGDGGSGGNAGSGRGGMGGSAIAGTGGMVGISGSAGMAGTAGTGGAGGNGNECTLTECGTDCVDPETTAAHCGVCDRACSNANGSDATCGSGLCSATCNAGFADCNVDDGNGADDGCETDLSQPATCGTTCENQVVCDEGDFCVNGACTSSCSDTECGTSCVTLPTSSDHCNACDRACSGDSVETRACVAGVCAPTCNTGFGDCSVDDGTGTDDGCETALDANAQNCGACDRACDGSNATDASCTAGICIPECSSGFGDCNVDDGDGADDGCETNLNTVETCGACDRACDDTNTSGLSCTTGTCAPTCNAGFADCNIDDGTGADDGCETDLNVATACGTTCGNRVECGVDEFCIAGACTATCDLTVCGTACVDTDTTATSCGACDRSCDDTNTTAVACTGGACAPTCSDGFGDCNVDQGGGADGGTDDGCETDFNSDESCGTDCADAVACGDGESCVSGVCTPDCAFAQCGGECTDTATVEEHCGDCDRTCLDDANVTSTTCSAGLCAAVCVAGRADCTQPTAPTADDGCETVLDSNASCGTGCGNVVACAANRSCVSGVCTPVNIVPNPGVESGFTPWTGAQGGNAAAATDQANTGLRSAVTVGRTQGYQGVGVNLFGLVTPGTTYDVSAFTRVSAPSATNGRMSARADCTSGNLYIMSRDAAVSSTAWTQFTGSFTVPSAAACTGFSALFVYFEQADASVQIYADDMVVTAR